MWLAIRQDLCWDSSEQYNFCSIPHRTQPIEDSGNSPFIANVIVRASLVFGCQVVVKHAPLFCQKAWQTTLAFRNFFRLSRHRKGELRRSESLPSDSRRILIWTMISLSVSFLEVFSGFPHAFSVLFSSVRSAGTLLAMACGTRWYIHLRDVSQGQHTGAFRFCFPCKVLYACWGPLVFFDSLNRRVRLSGKIKTNPGSDFKVHRRSLTFKQRCLNSVTETYNKNHKFKLHNSNFNLQTM